LSYLGFEKIQWFSSAQAPPLFFCRIYSVKPRTFSECQSFSSAIPSPNRNVLRILLPCYPFFFFFYFPGRFYLCTARSSHNCLDNPASPYWSHDSSPFWLPDIFPSELCFLRLRPLPSPSRLMKRLARHFPFGNREMPRHAFLKRPADDSSPKCVGALPFPVFFEESCLASQKKFLPALRIFIHLVR